MPDTFRSTFVSRPKSQSAPVYTNFQESDSPPSRSILNSSSSEEDVAADNGDTVHSRGNPIDFKGSCSSSRVPVESQHSASVQTDGSHDRPEHVKIKCPSPKEKLKDRLRKLFRIRAKRRHRDT